QDNDFVINNYSTSSDVLVIMVKTAPEGCAHYDTLAAMDELMWKMENTAGVQSAVSMVTVARQSIKGMNESSLKGVTMWRCQFVLNSSSAHAEGMYNGDCSLASLLVLINDHKAETLEHVVSAGREFAEANNRSGLEFVLAACNEGIEPATNEVIAA